MRTPVDSTFDRMNPYRILGVDVNAGPAAIRKAYLELVKRHHPNLFATDPEKYRLATELMRDINVAYELLSDTIQRGVWDRKHPNATAPRTAPRPEPEMDRRYDPSTMVDSNLVHTVIRAYNEFVNSLHTAEAKQEALKRIREFQASRAGSAFIRELVARHYRKIMDLLKLGRQISVYDDGLVEIMFLYTETLEVSPSDVFITYAYLQHRQSPGGARPRPNERPGPPYPGVYWTLGSQARRESGSARADPAKGITTRIRDWLFSPRRARRK
jgi:hypothetical protein